MADVRAGGIPESTPVLTPSSSNEGAGTVQPNAGPNETPMSKGGPASMNPNQGGDSFLESSDYRPTGDFNFDNNPKMKVIEMGS